MTTPQRSSARKNDSDNDSASPSGLRRTPLTRAAALAVSLLLVSGACALGAGPAASAAEPDSPSDSLSDSLSASGLRTDSLVNPIGLGSDAPEFTWQVQSDTRATLQQEYRIIVSSTADAADAGDADVWDSEWTTSDDSVDVTYAGPALAASSDYFWRVALRDNHGEESALSAPASFETGLFGASDWDADWIGDASSAATLAKWGNYSVEMSVSDISGGLGVYLRSDASTANAYMWQLSASATGAKLRPHKKTAGGYNSPPDIAIPAGFLNGEITSSTPNTFRFEVDGSTITTFVNDHQIDTRTDSSYAKGYVGFRTNGVERGIVHSVKVTTLGANPQKLVDTTFPLGDTTFTGGTQVSAGSMRFGNPASESMLTSISTEPIFRKDFTVDREVASARLYASALGVYEFRLNGERVGDLELAPGWTDYKTRVQYQAYDVTDQIEQGDNAIGALLGSGWYSGNLGWFGPNQYGTDPRLLGQLVITYDNGTTETIGTDDSWTTTTGPILSSDLLNGETYNGNLWQDGWDEADFDDSAWTAVVSDGDLATDLLVPQLDPPVRVTETRVPKSVTRVADGTWVFDLGQNMVGKVQLNIGGNSGNTVRLRHSEILHSDGTIAPENLRSAKATDYFTPVASGGQQSYTPRFTYHGFRYVEVTGLSGTPTTATVTGLVEGSDLDISSTFESSSAMLNQLQSNIVWGQRGNFLSVPTDTPARDERLGWTGDINVFAPTAAFNMYSEEFLRKWMTDMRDAQHANGAYPEVAPQFCTNKAIHDSCGAGSTGWADAGVTVPFVVWQSYGDTGIIRDNWDSMTSYIDFLDDQAVGNLRPGFGTWGDWLNLSDATPGAVLGSAFYAHSVDLMAQMAAAIGETDDAAAYKAEFETIKAAYQHAFISADGTITGGSQTAYAISIGMGLVPDDLVAKAGAKLADRVAAKGGHLSTGFLGTPYLLPALTASGQNDVAYSLMMSKTFPSWGYEVEMGATTMWERWDSLLPNGEPSDLSMNSFNHYAFGAVGDWMYQNIGGISSASAGYKHSVIAPNPGGGLTFAKVSHDSVYGQITSDWKLVNKRLELAVDVPANTTSTVRIPARNVHEVREGATDETTAADGADGVSSITMDGDDAVIEVGSGHYVFTISHVSGQFGAVLDDLDTVDSELGVLADAGTLSTATFAAATTRVEDARDAVDAASAENNTEPAASVHDALAAIAELVTLTGSLDAASLDSAIADVRAELSTLSAGFLGLDATIAAPDRLVPSERVTATVSLENTGTHSVTGVIAELATSTSTTGWSAQPTGNPGNTPLEAGDTRAAKFAVRSPGVIGDTDLAGTVSYRFNGSVATIPVTTAIEVASPLTATVPSTVVNVAPGSAAAVTVTLENESKNAVAVDLEASGTAANKGWRVASGSGSATVPAEGSIQVPVSVVAPEEVTGGTLSLSLALVVGGKSWGSVAVPLSASLSLDGPAVTEFDHVDLGNATSEGDHGITFSSKSGANTEAGKTRRYTDRTDPNGFMQFTMDVAAGKPFAINVLETYDINQTKEYNVFVNGQLVQHRLNNNTAGLGTVKYGIPVLDTSLTTTGKVTVRIANVPTGSNYDPSIADVWTTSYTDYVDIGAAGSELSHALTSSAKSLPGNEAGRTRRYTDRTDATGYFQFTATIVAGEPFLLQTVETYDREQHKVYDISVNGVAINQRDYERVVSGQGLVTYQVLVDDPALIANSTVTVKYANEPSGAFYDPSISDVWVTPAPADTTAPSVTAGIDGVQGQDGWFVGPVEITAQPKDNRGGTVAVEIKVGSADWADYDGPVTIDTDGTTAVGLRATDAAGNTSGIDETVIAVDQTQPVITTAETTTGIEQRSISLAATDATSGIDSLRYRVDSGEWVEVADATAETPAELVIQIAGAGEHTVVAIAEDVAGNRSTEKTVVSIADAIAPVVSTSLSATPVAGWIKAGTTLTISATDAGGVQDIQYRFAGSDWGTYSAPVVLPAGRYTISYRAIDETGNASVAGSSLYWADGTAPQTTPSVASSSTGGGSFTLGFTATDADSGVVATRYRIDGGEWDSYSGPVTVRGFGSRTVEFYSVDAVDNAEQKRSVSVSVKDVEALVAYSPPTVTGKPTIGSTLTASTGTWNTEGLQYSYQWLQGGAEISGAVSKTYPVVRSDIGKRISVRVTASKTGLVAVAATSASTSAVPKIVTTATVKAAKSSIKKKSTVSLTVTVRSSAGVPTGSAGIYVNGKKVKTVKLSNGAAKYSVRLSTKGTAKILVKYTGSAEYAADSSPTASVRVK